MKALYYTVTFLAALMVLTYTGFQTYLHWPVIVKTFEKVVPGKNDNGEEKKPGTCPDKKHRHGKGKHGCCPGPATCCCDKDCKCPTPNGGNCECSRTGKKCNDNCKCVPPALPSPGRKAPDAPPMNKADG